MISLQLSGARPPPATGVQYAPVTLSKFVVLAVVTFGLYPIVWFYRTWRFVKQRDRSDIWVWPRAIFAPFTYFGLLRDLRAHTGRELPSALAVLYFVLNALWRLPDPYWLVSVLSFVAVLPAVQAVNAANADVPSLPPRARWRGRNAFVILFGGTVLAFTTASMFGVVPSTRVVRGSDLSAGDVQFLLEAGIVGPDDAILYFYSPAVLSIRPAGVLLTEQGVTSYWIDPVSEQRLIARAPFHEIVDVETNPSSGPLADTLVRIHIVNGTWFMFVLSAEAGGDAEFLTALDDRLSRIRPPQPTA